jgi:TonB family protein
MRKSSKGERGHRTILLITAGLILIGFFTWSIFSTPTPPSWWKTLTRESKRILGWKEVELPPEEKRIREEVILKKMEEASAHQDWRSFTPEYPRSKKVESLPMKERMKAVQDSSEFKETEKELKEYLKKREELFDLEPPIPSLKEASDFTHLEDKGTEKVIERLMAAKKKALPEKPLEENLLLGIQGPLAFRKILEKPQPLHVKVKVEAEIELTLWVLPDGRVDRVIPSVKGDAELERIAIQYLKQWRFAPLPREGPQVEQWGTIPIKFRLQ